jgi:hypothetical protein
MQEMPGGLRQKPHECKLAPTIAVAKGMDGIERRQEGRRATCELLSGKRLQIILASQIPEQFRHFPGNMFRIAKSAVALADPYLFPILARPGVHISENVSVDTPLVLFGQLAGRHRFAEALRGNCCLKAVERLLGAEIAAVLKNGRSGIAIGIVYAVIYRQD